MRDYKKLRAFELADDLVILIYMITKTFPKEEAYGLTSQMRRAAVSIPSNIVEGCSRESKSEFLRFLEIAFSSLKELHYQFSIAIRLTYVNLDDIDKCELKLSETGKVLGALIRSIKRL